jgi:hypothetical protein
MKKVAGVKALFRRSGGEIQVGRKTANLSPQQLVPSDPANPVGLFDGYKDLNILGSWERDTQIVIRRTQPLPVNILALVPELVTGSK